MSSTRSWVRKVGDVLWAVAGLLVLGGVFARGWAAASDVVREPPGAVESAAVRVVRKCKPPEKGWCVLDLAQLDSPVPEMCECGPLPRELVALTEPDRSWGALKEYRKRVRKGGK